MADSVAFIRDSIGEFVRQPATRLSLFALLILAALVGCNEEAMIERITPRGLEANARRYVDLIRQRKLDAIEREMDPSLRTGDSRDQLVAMADLFPAGEPSSVKEVGLVEFRRAGVSGNSITLEYEFSGKWLLANFVTETRGGAVVITGFHARAVSASIESMNRFTLRGKSGEQYAVLFLAVGATLVSFYAFVICLRTRMGKKKWIWALVSLLGVTQVGVNWTTGEMGFTLWAFHFPPAAMHKPFFGAWILEASLPVGAVVFLMLRDRMIAERSPSFGEGDGDFGGQGDDPTAGPSTR